MDALYSDPDLVAVYDGLNAGRSDHAFYRARLPLPPCHVLDLGCGTGTFAIELSDAGYAVTGIDPAGQMIAHARHKSGAQRVHWHVGTVADLPLDARFDAVVMTGHAFQCVLEDDTVSAMFAHIAQRLDRQGSFWFETRNPAAKPWTAWTPDHARPAIDLGAGRTVQVVHDVLAVDEHYVIFSETYMLNGGARVVPSQSRLRFMPLETISGLAARAHLRVHSVFGDWDGGALQPDSPEIIVDLKHA